VLELRLSSSAHPMHPVKCIEVHHYLLYKLFHWVSMQPCCVSHDPILSASLGQMSVIKPDILKFYLFCESNANYCIDAAPVHTNTLGHWNRQMLERMGSAPRGFSAHCSGSLGRACVLVLLRGKGVALSSDTVDVIARLGGWSCVGGNQTVMQVYTVAGCVSQ